MSGIEDDLRCKDGIVCGTCVWSTERAPGKARHAGSNSEDVFIQNLKIDGGLSKRRQGGPSS